jgi:hypothetical protein
MENKNKVFGKITSVEFGYGGYQDAMFGLNIELSGNGWECGDFYGDWGIHIQPDKYSKWTEKDRTEKFAKMCTYINKLLIEAKITYISELKNIPIEATFRDNTLVSWRILTEVL